MKYQIVQNNLFPTIPNSIEHLFLDTETTSFDPNKTSIDVWKSCWIAGIAFTWDDEETIWFIPIRYRDQYSEEKNNDPKLTKEYISEVLKRTRLWINHNIKYDMHVLVREGYFNLGVPLFDTLTQAKLIESDRFFYNEDTLAADWLHIENVDLHKQAMKPWIESSKDWGEVPIHKIAPYAAHDIYKERLLFNYICEHMNPETYNVSAMENRVTRCLCRCEQVGLNVDSTQLKVEELTVSVKMLEILEKIRREHGVIIRPNVNADCYELFHNQFKLPVVAMTEGGKDGKSEPSYDKFALATLMKYPGAPKELIEDCLSYREYVSYNGFIKSYQDHQLEGRMHASYNQCIRTGRMSCSEPNMQQLNKEAKNLIHPPAGYIFISCDYSSIEFRLLAHYLGQSEIIDAYLKDPDTDFHQWVADMCSVKRKPAKNINFCMAYGGGKGKVLSMLASNADIIEEITADSPEQFESMCRMRAEAIYTKYHQVLYKLRPLTTLAANRLKARGYVKNGYGRLRHLPAKATYRALNTVIQSTAADCMKEAVVNTSPIFNPILAEYGIEQVAYVHDEILFICPKEHFDPYYFDMNNVETNEKDEKKYKLADREPILLIQEITSSMLKGTEKFSVPLRVSVSLGLNNWADLIELPKELIYE